MEIYRHTTRADSAELATEKTFRPAPTEKWFGRVLLNKARPIRTILSFTIFEKRALGPPVLDKYAVL